MRRAPQKPGEDVLPPHSDEAESAVLGCILLAASGVSPEWTARKAFDLVEERIGAAMDSFQSGTAARVFFNLRHEEIYRALRGLVADGKEIDVILLQQRLRDHDKLDSCGGRGYVSALPDKVPGVSMVEHYLAEVWNKFLARQLIQGGIALASATQAQGTVDDGILGQFVARVEALRRSAAPEEATKRIRQPVEYGEAVYNLWFGSEKGEPGKRLPSDAFGDFPFRFRGSEFTWCVGESGGGKSTLLQYFLLHLMHQETLCLIASMEMRPAITLRMMVKQLAGVGHLPDNADGHATLSKAMKWLNERLYIYDFLGIADWRELVRALTELVKGLKEKEVPGDRGRFDTIGEPRVVVLVDNVMRLGIPEDDLAQESACAQSLTTWVQEYNAHMLMVSHTNKGDGAVKQRSRGSKRWTDAAQNILEIERNEKKGQKVDDLRQQLREKKINDAKFREEMEKHWGEWDGRMTLHKQRLDGSRQNGRIYLSFDPESLQFSREPRDRAVDWLSQWSKKG